MNRIFGISLLAATLAAGAGLAQTASIAAVVNGQVITNQDVAARARLLAVSTGMPITPDLITRLAPQVTNQLIDQTLELQEINRRNVVVNESDIAGAIAHIEQGNNLPAGGLKAHLADAGVPFDTLISQLRIELGWQDVLHKVLGPGLQPTLGDLNAEKTALKSQVGSTQYHISEIFVQVSDPASDATARQFADEVIKQLRSGAPFPVIAAQFSQAPSALQGGDLGFVQLSQLDPAVAAIVQEMPPGAVSNPVRVPGGYDIVQLQQVHKMGTDVQTILSLRQVFAPFSPPIAPGGSIGPAQGAVIEKLRVASAKAHACSDMDAVNAEFGTVHPADPGPVDIASVTPPAFQKLLATMPLNQASQPLVAADGATVVMVCSRQSQATGLPSDQEIGNIIVNQRVQLESQQLLDSLRHQSIITQDGTQQ